MSVLRSLFITSGVATVIAFTAAVAYAISAEDFARKASIANLFEIEISKVALERATHPEVKVFAQQMIDDHTKTDENFKTALAKSESGAKAAIQLDEKHQKKLDKLQSAATETFDKEYIAIQTDAHKEVVDLFSDYAGDGDDAALKEFATNTLPTLQKHKQHVVQLEETIK